MSANVSLYDFTVPEFRTMLTNLKHILDIGEAFAQEKGISEEELLSSRLAPDMFDLKKQVQLATDHAKGTVGRLTGTEFPVFENNETTVSQLKSRIDQTIQYIDTFRPSQFNDAPTRDIELVFPWRAYHFTGLTFLQRWALPNFFFHVTTAYDILRNKGVQLGKKDYLGEIPN